MADPRSWPSECFALAELGLSASNRLHSETELIELHRRTVPEGIFRHPLTQRIISVEVKRIVGNTLPSDARRKLRDRRGIMWPWRNTVHMAIAKAHDDIVRLHGVEEHHVVFVVPDTLARRAYDRLVRHIIDATNEYLRCAYHPLDSKCIHTYVARGPPALFDRGV